MKLDTRDRQILEWLQRRADMPLDALAAKVSLSPSACWRRVRKLEEEGYIARRVAVIDRVKVGLPITVFAMIKTAQHSEEWLARFRDVVATTPQIVEMHRLTGDVDYLLEIVLPDIESLDGVYKRLVSRLPFTDISSYISMEKVKDKTVIPLDYL